MAEPKFRFDQGAGRQATPQRRAVCRRRPGRARALQHLAGTFRPTLHL